MKHDAVEEYQNIFAELPMHYIYLCSYKISIFFKKRVGRTKDEAGVQLVFYNSLALMTLLGRCRVGPGGLSLSRSTAWVGAAPGATGH